MIWKQIRTYSGRYKKNIRRYHTILLYLYNTTINNNMQTTYPNTLRLSHNNPSMLEKKPSVLNIIQ